MLNHIANFSKILETSRIFYKIFKFLELSRTSWAIVFLENFKIMKTNFVMLFITFGASLFINLCPIYNNVWNQKMDLRSETSNCICSECTLELTPTEKKSENENQNGLNIWNIHGFSFSQEYNRISKDVFYEKLTVER